MTQIGSGRVVVYLLEDLADDRSGDARPVTGAGYEGHDTHVNHLAWLTVVASRVAGRDRHALKSDTETATRAAWQQVGDSSGANSEPSRQQDGTESVSRCLPEAEQLGHTGFAVSGGAVKAEGEHLHAVTGDLGEVGGHGGDARRAARAAAGHEPHQGRLATKRRDRRARTGGSRGRPVGSQREAGSPCRRPGGGRRRRGGRAGRRSRFALVAGEEVRRRLSRRQRRLRRRPWGGGGGRAGEPG